MSPSDLIIGATCYRLTFADRDLTMPGLEPLVFLGRIEVDAGLPTLAFQDTVSYMRFGPGHELDAAENDEDLLYLVRDDDVGHDILSLTRAAQAVAEAAARALSLGSPKLGVLRTGWQPLD